MMLFHIFPYRWNHIGREPYIRIYHQMIKAAFLHGQAYGTVVATAIPRIVLMKVLYLETTLNMLSDVLVALHVLLEFLPGWLFAKRNKRYELAHSKYKHIMNVPCLSGCFMFLRMSTLKETGLFDERYFMYAEDFDLTRRIHRKYKTLFFPQVSIYHKFSRGSHRSLRLFFAHTTSMVRYFFKYGWFYDNERRHFNHRILEEIKQMQG